MRRSDPAGCAIVLACFVTMGPGLLQAAPMQVTQVFPPRNSVAPATTAIVIDFDKPVIPASLSLSTFRVFGKASGAKTGTLVRSNGGLRVTFQPTEPFSAGETVRVNLSHDLATLNQTTLRSAGYFYQFQIQTVPSGTFQQIAVLSTRTLGDRTRLYGAAATDLNNDGYLDLATTNEVSGDVRVFLNRADGSGLFQPILAPVPAGVGASPNDPADFNNDGNTDLCISSENSNSVWVLLGAGDGTFSSTQQIAVDVSPRGIAALDIDGDGDADIVNANEDGNILALMINNGSGVFGPASFFEGGVDGEYGLAAADMNNDGIADVVVAGTNGWDLQVQLGNGDETFTSSGPSQGCGGAVWVLVVDDLNGDGNLDASVANSSNGNGAILLGNGAGALGAPAIISTGGHAASTDLGDLDGDGDSDLILANGTLGAWYFYRNNGAGSFAFQQQFNAPGVPSCAVLFDSDNDGDLDMALTDEDADQVLLMRNVATADVEPTDEWERFTMLSNVPNPFRVETDVRFVLAIPADVRLDVFDTGGRRVAGTDPVHRDAGHQEVRFDGRDGSGKPLGTGVYLYRVTAGDIVGTGKMVLAR